MTRLQPVDIGGNSWDNVNSPRSAVNTSEGLTHHLIRTERGLS